MSQKEARRDFVIESARDEGSKITYNGKYES